MKTHLLYFPCRNALFDWFGDDSSVTPRVTVALLSEQRDYECLSGNNDKRITCHACANPAARYVVCRRRGNGKDLLYPRRYPGSARWHTPGCFSYSAELIAPDGETKPDSITGPGGDFAALWREVGDPEFRVVAMRQRRPGQPAASSVSSRRAVSRMTVSLQRLTRDLLQRSGVCTWRPEYQAARNERVFNGLIKGALDDIARDSGGAAHAVLNSLPGVNFVPWSFLNEHDRKTPVGMTGCVGFGFIESLSPENERGARLMRLSNHPDCPILVPRVVLESEERKPASPLHSYLAHPTWCIFVASLYAGTWKIHAFVPIRVSTIGLIPTESHFEDRMVARLIKEERGFVRWLLPPPGIVGHRFVPDFQLQDTAAREFIEVAGLMSSPDYAENIRRKCRAYGTRLLVWDTRTALSGFVLPTPANPVV